MDVRDEVLRRGITVLPYNWCASACVWLIVASEHVIAAPGTEFKPSPVKRLRRDARGNWTARNNVPGCPKDKIDECTQKVLRSHRYWDPMYYFRVSYEDGYNWAAGRGAQMTTPRARKAGLVTDVMPPDEHAWIRNYVNTRLREVRHGRR